VSEERRKDLIKRIERAQEVFVALLREYQNELYAETTKFDGTIEIKIEPYYDGGHIHVESQNPFVTYVPPRLDYIVTSFDNKSNPDPRQYRQRWRAEYRDWDKDPYNFEDRIRWRKYYDRDWDKDE